MKTRAIILNSPNNPTGKGFRRKALQSCRAPDNTLHGEKKPWSEYHGFPLQ
jgi:hypothetical protein